MTSSPGDKVIPNRKSVRIDKNGDVLPGNEYNWAKMSLLLLALFVLVEAIFGLIQIPIPDMLNYLIVLITGAILANINKLTSS